MNKTSKKRAFFVVFAICLVYISVAFRITDLFSMRRVLPDHSSQTSPMNVYAGGLEKEETSGNSPKPAEETDQTRDTLPFPASAQETSPRYAPGMTLRSEHVKEPTKNRVGAAVAANDELPVEPSLLIALPVICHALKEGRVDKNGLIFSKKNGYNNGNWKKPADILRDHDEEGVKVLLHTIGKDFLLETLRKEGIQVRPDVSTEQLMAGKGYTVDRKKLLSLYHLHVADGYNDLFPFMLPTAGVIRTKAGFELVGPMKTVKPAKAEEEWLMPNLANLPLRLAVEKLAAHTSKIKVYGSGVVVEQSPRPFERLRGEPECSIQGRLYSQ